MIELQNVARSYGDEWAIRDVDLRIEDGEFAAIVGPSGSGKTTLLNVIAGLLTPTEGDVAIDGISLYGLSQSARAAFRRKFFGFVFQAFNLIPYLTVLQNVEISLYLAGLGTRDQKGRACESLGRVGLESKTGSFPGELSAGEQQRVAVARALANEPRIIFADEPTGNLDSRNGKEMMTYLKEQNLKGSTVLLVTHDSAMADFAQRKIGLADGRLCREG